MLLTKLYPPPLFNEYIDRPQLIERLSNNVDKPLTLVSAGAGYGKSILISSWLQQSQRPYCWVSLSEEDNGLQDFLNYVYTALDSCFPEKFKQTKAYVQTQNLPPLTEVVHNLINELDQIDEAFTLVLDDFHTIDNEDIIMLMDELLRFPPQCLHTVIITRVDPSFRISALRAQNRITEVRSKDLIFSRQEIGRFFNNLMGIDLSQETESKLSLATEGWITGLKLISFALGESTSENELISYCESQPFLAYEFLFDEVFNTLPEPKRQALLVSSLFEEFCPALLDTVNNDEESMSGDEFINWLREYNLFTVPLDNDRKWYRYHHLFSELLRNHLNTLLGSKKISGYTSRASIWFLENGFIGKGIKHTILSGDLEQANSIIEERRNNELENDRWYDLELWLSQIPKKARDENALFQLTYAWIFYQQSDFPQLVDIIENLNKKSEELQPSLKAELLFFNGMLSYVEGQGKASEDFIGSALELLPSKPGLILGEAELFYGLSLQMNGDKAGAIKVFEGCIEKAKPADIMYLTRIQGGICYSAILAADFLGARVTTLKWIEISLQSKSEYALSWSEYINGYTELSLCNLPKALQAFDSAVSRRHISEMSVSVNSFLGSALTLWHLNRIDEAESRLREAQLYVESMNDHEFLEIFASVQARLNLLKGDINSALTWARSAREENYPFELFLWINAPIITRCHILIVGGNDEEVVKAIDTLIEVRKTMQQVGLLCHELDVLILLALAYQKSGSPEQSMAILEEAVQLAEPRKWLRPFVELASPLVASLEELKNNGVAIDFLEGVLGLVPGSSPSDAPPRKNRTSSIGPESLTARELETIENLVNGLRNKEIADKMFISLDAVKKHLYRIFQKLNVSNRIELVNLVKELDLLKKKE